MNASMSARKSATSFGMVKSMACYLPRAPPDRRWSHGRGLSYTTTMQRRFDLAGKAIVVTGGSRGLGLAMARAFAEHGADVVIASRKLGACERVAAELRERFGHRALAVPFHAGSWKDCERLIETVHADLGRLDVLVNNAGISPLYPSLEAVTEELYDKVLDVNLKGPFRLAALAAARMADAGGCDVARVRRPGARQRHHAGRVPHRHQQGVERRGPRARRGHGSRGALR